MMTKTTRTLIGWTGVVIAAPFFAWFVIGFIDVVPSMIDVFGQNGLRTPAAITIAGLLVAAIGFQEF